MKIAVKVLKMIGIAVLVIVVLLAILIFRIFTAPMVPKDYTKTVKTGGAIEAAYMAAGQYQVRPRAIGRNLWPTIRLIWRKAKARSRLSFLSMEQVSGPPSIKHCFSI